MLYRSDYKDNLKKSAEEFNKAIEISPNFTDAKIELANAYLELADIDDISSYIILAENILKNLPDKNGYEYKTSLIEAELLRLKSLVGDSQKIYTALIKRYPHSSIAWYGLAETYKSLGEQEKAEECYLKSINLRPTWFGYNNLATFYYKTGQLAKALNVYKKLAEISPNNHVVFQTLGAINFARSDSVGALNAFYRAVELSPTAINYSNVATVLFYQKKYNDAIKYFELAVALNDKHYVLWGNLADTYRLLGLNSESLKAYNKAIELVEDVLKTKPNSERLRLRRALFLAKTDRKNEAISVLNDISKLPDNNMLVIAAQISEICGFRSRAIDYLKNAVASGYNETAIFDEPEFKKLIEKEPNFLN